MFIAFHTCRNYFIFMILLQKLISPRHIEICKFAFYIKILVLAAKSFYEFLFAITILAYGLDKNQQKNLHSQDIPILICYNIYEV